MLKVNNNMQLPAGFGVSTAADFEEINADWE